MSEFLHLMANPAHWGFEIVSGAIIGATISPLVKRLIRRHDRKHHAPKHDHTAIYTEIEELRLRVWSLERHTH